MDIVVWLRSLGLEEYEAAFRDNKINEWVLPNLTQEDLKEIGVGPVGHQPNRIRKLLSCRASSSETRTAREHPRGGPVAPAWRLGLGSPKPAAKNSTPANRAAMPRLLLLQTERALAGRHRIHPRAGQQTAQKAVSLRFRHQAETRAIRTLHRGPLRMPAGMATRDRNCNRASHKEGETEATDLVERPSRFSQTRQA